jgi:hypothetical protein
VDFFWEVKPDRHGRRQQGGPGTWGNIRNDLGDEICLTIPERVVAGTRIEIRVEINAATGAVRELSNSLQAAPISGTPRYA